MPFKYEKIPGFAAGLINRYDPRDIKLRDPRGLSKAQNISLDVGGKIMTIGGLADFTKVDGVTALTQTAKLCPGASLLTYGSDHWRGTDTIVDALAADNAASDEGGEVDAVGSWTESAGTIASVADTDGGAIASNGTSYIIKITNVDVPVIIYAAQSFNTVVGQKYKAHVDTYCKDANWIYFQIQDPFIVLPINTTASWVEDSIEFTATQTTTEIRIYSSGSVGEITYFDDVYVTAIPRSDLDTNWLALADVATAQVDLYNVNDDSFTAGLLDFGTVSSFVGAAAGNVDFPTVSTITDSASTFLNQGVQAGDVRIVSGCSTTTANNIIFVVDRVIAGTVYARGSPFTVTAAEAGTVTLTKYNPTAFHYVNEALRASPANGGIALRPKHYSFADRTHFEGADSSERKFSDWYANDVGPVAPISASAHTTNGNVATQAELVAGTGFEVGITRTVDDGEWTAGTYIIAIAFKYDDGQVSALYVPTTDEEFGTAILDGDSLTLTVRGKMSSTVNYDERISGGYIFCRKDESDEPWSLLTEISMAKGARATLSGTYNSWAESSTSYEAYTANFKSLKLNIDSYENLAGIDPTTTVEVFTDNNAFWNTSVIARNRCFIGAPRYTAEGGALSHFRDRILYSTVGAYDTFPIDNYIDVVQGDAEDYVKLGAYGNDLLCFKQRTLYIIDISDPDPAGWQMKQDANKGKYPFRGIAHPGAYFETPIGPAWCNKFGVFLYNGSEIVPLLGDKIELSEHPLAYLRYMEFDGSNDYVTKTNDADLNFGVNTDFSVEVICKVDTVPADFTRIAMKGGALLFYAMMVRSTGVAQFYLDDNVVEKSAAGLTTIDDGEYHHIIGTADRSSATGLNLYRDGISDATAVDISAMTTIDDATKPFAIGINSSDLSSQAFDGDIALVRIWNRALSAAEVLALYNGQPVLAADQWGSQTNLITDTDDQNFTGGDIGNWTVTTDGNGTVTYSAGPGAEKTGLITVGGTAGTYTQAALLTTKATALVEGKNYRMSSDVYLPSANNNWTLVGISLGGIDATQISITNATLTTEDAWQRVSYEFTAGSDVVGTFYVRGLGTTTGDLIYYDNVEIVRIGCVAEYAPKGIGDAQWDDESGNSLDGTVVGATAIYEDSWAKFYTDYSILGYHALTNQIIVMRDCTGKWSSGQDYGDAWIIDLDTLASTTGRRVFTKGIAYSNWATDWDQNLIIAEQTSSTSVTIKKWTDEPQSQAVGLIDIRTADIDFGNPAYAKFFDALVAYYKSSAAQTTPFSYALDGDDRFVAWTRITGNFTAEEFWEKLTLEPTTFECDTIRFKIDAPTAAGTMEINDLTIRYSEEPEDID